MEFSPPLTILFLASAGFYFATQCYLLKYRVIRESGHKLYLSALACGAVLLLISQSLYYFQELIWLDLLKYPTIFVISDEASFITVMTLPLSVLIALLINKIDSIKEHSWIKAISKNDVDSLCYEAATDFKPISITLDTRKVYIGLVYDSLEPEKEGYLTILPLYSGYRDKDNLEFNLDKKYRSVYLLIDQLEEDLTEKESEEKLAELSDYRVVIPKERIVTINISANLLYNEIDEPKAYF